MSSSSSPHDPLHPDDAAKYARMLRAGVPRAAVLEAIGRDGVAPAAAGAEAALDALARSAAARPRVAFLWHELFAWHDSALESYAPHVQPHGSNESAESKRRLANLVAITPLGEALARLAPRAATDEELLRVHTPRYLAQVKAVSASLSGGMVGHEMQIGPRGFEIAALSAGGVLRAVEEVASGALARAYCLVRPPGHHAEADQGHGFCCFSNVGVAAAHAIAKLGLRRVAVVDYDVHHGNGTEAQFIARDDLLFVSLHQDRLYPLDTGDVDVVGDGAGRGYNLNVPLPPGSGVGAYAYAFERVVLPALRAYKPELILVSSGFDPSFLDTLGRMLLRAEDFGLMAKMLCDAADELCGGKIVFSHEGGYSEVYVPFCGVAVLEAMSGVASGVVDPFARDVGPARQIALQPHQRAAVDLAAENLKIALVK